MQRFLHMACGEGQVAGPPGSLLKTDVAHRSWIAIKTWKEVLWWEGNLTHL